MRVKLFGSLAATSIAVGLLASVPAHAASVSGAGSAAVKATSVLGTAPACVARYVSDFHKAIVLRNTCGKKMWVKVIIKRGPDSPCFGIGKGSVRAWKWGTPLSKYDKTVTC
ncbi:hypothetical protein [Nonomuraea endophytica]|uniref:Uncharacterized protein n=1 Tax=Nonomuraea endophytica TaxID=714136 RepID=A0A7W8EI47_9ACTN|nr:hypothetical protein [Nonomuraea endophytica]MBB5081610.1 hypothetical protein [Nonomuraea endophytica]